MITNYLLVTLRNLLKNKLYTFINVFGLALGLTAFFFITQYVRFERSYEDFNVNKDNIYRIYINLYKDAEFVGTDCETHAPFGPAVKDKFPEVVNYVRMAKFDGQTEVEIGTDKFLEENIYATDSSLTSVFTIHFIEGDPQTSLVQPMHAVLTKSLAQKYFGKTQGLLGRSMVIDHNNYTISGVTEDFPPNSHLKISMFISHATLAATPFSRYDEAVWVGNNEYTYLLMKPGASLSDFNRKISALSASMKESLNNAVYAAEPVKDIHLYSNKGYEPDVNGSATLVWIMLTVGAFILIIAWVNYVNLSTAKAMNRAREVGVRKVLGSLRTQLIAQFFAESFVLNVLAGGLSLVILWLTFPFLRDLSGQPLSSAFLSDRGFWYLLTAVIIAGTVLSGVYPALVLSSFQPAAVLKGKLQSTPGGRLLRQGLVVFQFSATLIMIVCMVVIYTQITYLRNYNLGMKIDQTLVVRAPQIDVPDSTYQDLYSGFRNDVLRQSQVTSVARTQAIMGTALSEVPSTYFSRVGDDEKRGRYYYHNFGVDAEFVPQMGLTIVAGKNFDRTSAQFYEAIINEEAVKSFGFESNEAAIGGKITTTRYKLDRPFEIVGVVKNFSFRSPKEAPIPMFFGYSSWARYFLVHADAGRPEEVIALVRTSWEKAYPGALFDYFFLDENYNRQYESDTRFGNVTAAFCLLATLIACLGLFGLASYTVMQRTKEIGIRKVLGASVSQIVQLLSFDFIKIVLIASALATPIAYFAVMNWLSGYSVKVNLNIWLFGLPILLILIIALLTVSFQTVKTALTNPSKVLSE
jgi:putative ABC transport system permease protein